MGADPIAAVSLDQQAADRYRRGGSLAQATSAHSQTLSTDRHLPDYEQQVGNTFFLSIAIVCPGCSSL